MVVELNMQYCGHIFKDSFETYKTFLRRIFTEFERKVDVQNLIQILVSIISYYSQRFSGIFIEKTTFEEFVEICKQIHRK